MISLERVETIKPPTAEEPHTFVLETPDGEFKLRGLSTDEVENWIV